MNILVIGSGGREAAIVWKLAQSRSVTSLWCCPGNPGIGQYATCVPVNAGDTATLLELARSKRIDLTIVGPEQPLADGIADLFRSHGMMVFGPSRMAARLEWSKAWAKEFMDRYGIPTARSRVFTAEDRAAVQEYVRNVPLPVVLKADGLAAGKGVLICRTRDEAVGGLRGMMEEKIFGKAGERVVVEEMLEGEEASVFAVCCGKDYVTLAPAQDYKRVFDGDEGKNTGGMGSYAPAPVVTPEVLSSVCSRIIEPTLLGMEQEGVPYTGCLYVGLMIGRDGPRVIEYNSRLGDPETQVVLPLFDGDLPGLLMAASDGTLKEWKSTHRCNAVAGAGVCVVLASSGYPDAYRTGARIDGLEQLALLPHVAAFHAGTSRSGDHIVTAGGRVLGVMAHSPEGSLASAVTSAYEAVRQVSFSGMHYRKDIGLRALARRGEAR
jgi:phosphoribosylamine--glycine ligase